MSNALILSQILLDFLGKADQIARLLNRTTAEGRDATKEELDELAGDDDVMRAKLQAAIDARKA